MYIQKYLSQKKILSRRETEKYIEKGLIKLNGKTVEKMGIDIDPSKDKIEILETPENLIAKKITVAVYKPRRVVSSKLESEGETIFQILPQFKNLNTVGRLDKASEGLILLSNDGIITNTVTGDKHLIEKEYVVTTREDIVPAQMTKMAEGIILEDGMTLPAQTKKLSKNSFSIILKEGRKHQIRRMADAVNLTITSLKRIRIGNITLGNLKQGQYRILNQKEINELKNQG